MLLTYSKLLFSVCFLICAFQDARPAISNEFRSSFAGFAIDAGGRPTRAEFIHQDVGTYAIFGPAFEWHDKGAKIRIAAHLVTSDSSTTRRQQQPAILDLMIKQSTVELQNAGLQFSQAPYAFASSRGREVKATGKYFFAERVFFVGEILYNISLTTPDKETFDSNYPILDKFRLLTKAERIVALIEDSNAIPMPQETADERAGPETVWYDLKGPVQRFREEFQSKPGAGSEVTQEVWFDQNGFITSEITFGNGYPELITTWGWVEGQRVNSQTTIPFLRSEMPPPTHRLTVGGGADEIYGVRFESAYDIKGRITEQKCFSNTGTLVFRKRFVYTERSMEIIETDDRGGFLGRSREIRDDAGIVVEHQILSDIGLVIESKKFEYRSDDRGNWIEKWVVRPVRVGRRTVTERSGGYKRDIRYYDEDKMQDPVASVARPIY